MTSNSTRSEAVIPRYHCPSCGAGLPDSLFASEGDGAPRNQSTAPPGFASQRLQIIDLGPEIGVHGRGLRMSRVTVSPGAYFPAHSHRDQPEIICVLEGQLTEERNGGPPMNYGPGSVLTMLKGVTHTLANRTAAPTVYMSTSVKR